MAVQYGKCSNRSACSLAFSGEVIRFDGPPVCPACGGPLTLVGASGETKAGGGGGSGAKIGLILAIVGVVLLLLFGVAGYVVYNIFFSPQPTPTPSPTPVVSVTPSPSATPTSSVTPTPTPSESPSPTPTPSASPTATPTASPSASVSPSPSPTVTPSPTATPSPSASASASPSGADLNTNPKQLNTSELDTVRSDVIKRINAMPKVSKDEKDRLIEKVQTAKTLELLRVVHFDLGKSNLSKNLSDQLISSIHGSAMESKLSDPTTVLVVAGYADSGGDQQLNFKLSNERAEYVAKLLRQEGNILNVIHTVAMGATDLLDSKRPDQNRAVEIWAVTP